jgi:hypothetical protein
MAPGKEKSMKILSMIFPLLFVATTAFALPGDPPLWGGSCDPEKVINIKNPDFAVPVELVHKWIEERGIRMFKAKIDPFLEIDPKTGEKTIYRERHQPQVDAATREVEEWQRWAKDKAERYMEVDPCPDGMGLVIRNKYVDLIW